MKKTKKKNNKVFIWEYRKEREGRKKSFIHHMFWWEKRYMIYVTQRPRVFYQRNDFFFSHAQKRPPKRGIVIDWGKKKWKWTKIVEWPEQEKKTENKILTGGGGNVQSHPFFLGNCIIIKESEERHDGHTRRRERLEIVKFGVNKRTNKRTIKEPMEMDFSEARARQWLVRSMQGCFSRMRTQMMMMMVDHGMFRKFVEKKTTVHDTTIFMR